MLKTPLRANLDRHMATADPAFSTQTEAAARLLSDAILSGRMAPGSRLHVRSLSGELGIGPTPLREALANLAGRGLVTFSGQRGFRVASTSREDLEEIMAARTVVEKGALALSIANGDGDWEADIVAALHRLKLFTDNPPASHDEQVEAFELVHRRFHLSLIAACRTDRLISIYLDLYEQTRRYRALLVNSAMEPANVFEKHQALAASCLARDEQGALALLEEHNSFLVSIIYGDR